MHLTTFTDYCLRVLVYVGTRGDSLSTIDDVAAGYGISRNHLMKVVSRLSRLGYLVTVRGRNGGLRLSREPGSIVIGQVVRETEEEMSIVACFQPGGDHCRIESACVLKSALAEALEAFLSVLDGYTLADLLEPRSRLIDLMRIPLPGPANGDASAGAVQ